jgi:hypothetical protein
VLQRDIPQFDGLWTYLFAMLRQEENDFRINELWIQKALKCTISGEFGSIKLQSSTQVPQKQCFSQISSSLSRGSPCCWLTFSLEFSSYREMTLGVQCNWQISKHEQWNASIIILAQGEITAKAQNKMLLTRSWQFKIGISNDFCGRSFGNDSCCADWMFSQDFQVHHGFRHFLLSWWLKRVGMPSRESSESSFTKYVSIERDWIHVMRTVTAISRNANASRCNAQFHSLCQTNHSFKANKHPFVISAHSGNHLLSVTFWASSGNQHSITERHLHEESVWMCVVFCSSPHQSVRSIDRPNCGNTELRGRRAGIGDMNARDRLWSNSESHTLHTAIATPPQFDSKWPSQWWSATPNSLSDLGPALMKPIIFLVADSHRTEWRWVDREWDRVEITRISMIKNAVIASQ